MRNNVHVFNEGGYAKTRLELALLLDKAEYLDETDEKFVKEMIKELNGYESRVYNRKVSGGAEVIRYLTSSNLVSVEDIAEELGGSHSLKAILDGEKILPTEAIESLIERFSLNHKAWIA